MRILLPGGSGQLGRLLERYWGGLGHEVVVLTRSPRPATADHPWDGLTLGPWAALVDGADVVVNLAGRSVNCRYTEANLREMLDSRIASTQVVGDAIARAQRPPRVWMQMSTATIYAHRLDADNDEAEGLIGGHEPNVPAYWARSVRIAEEWEAAVFRRPLPHTREVALRTAMVMSSEPGGVFDVLRTLTRRGLGGPVGGGEQFVSWIHAQDFCRALTFLIGRTHLDGPVNIASPNPLPQRELMRHIRRALDVRWGLPASRWMAEVGAFFLRTDTELLLKSRRVVPSRLMAAGFGFDYPGWPEAVDALVNHPAMDHQQGQS